MQEITAINVCGMFVTIAGVVVVSLEGVGNKRNNKLGDVEQLSSIEDNACASDCILELTLTEQQAGCDTSEDQHLDDESHSTFLETIFLSNLSRGYMLAVLNVVLDCLGSVLTKMYGEDFNTWEINFIRFGSASIVMGILASGGKVIHDGSWGSITTPLSHTRSEEDMPSHHTASLSLSSSSGGKEEEEEEDGCKVNLTKGDDVGDDRDDDDQPNDSFWFNMPFATMSRHAWLQVTMGVMFVTFLCPVLSIYALFTMDVALCLTLTSLGPVFSLPLVYLMKHETITLRGLGGTVVACVGVVMLTAL